MHQIVLLTAMTATSGLFGGHHVKAKHSGAAYTRSACVATVPATTCRTGTCPTAYAPAPRYVYTSAPAAAPRMAATAPAYRTSYYYPPASTCATGTCPRR